MRRRIALGLVLPDVFFSLAHYFSHTDFGIQRKWGYGDLLSCTGDRSIHGCSHQLCFWVDFGFYVAVNIVYVILWADFVIN